jgi:hypothetical protein
LVINKLHILHELKERAFYKDLNTGGQDQGSFSGVVVFPRNNHSLPSSSPMLKAEPPSVYGCPGSWKKKAIIMGK